MNLNTDGPCFIVTTIFAENWLNINMRWWTLTKSTRQAEALKKLMYVIMHAIINHSGWFEYNDIFKWSF